MTDNIFTTLADIQALQESAEVECKLAGGRDGKGAVPNDMWETYSAFANTRGGIILLGIQEKKGHFTLEGITNPTPLVKNIWDTVNNPNKVSINLLSEADVSVETIDGKNIIVVHVPRAPRKIRPVFINNNPHTGTYIRRYEADQKCLPSAINQMMAEQEEVRDNRLMEGFTIDDIEPESLRVYRQLFVDAKPDHAFSELSDHEFLRSIRCIGKDRSTGKEWLTLAGLVMFGRGNSILDALPAFALDYQEKSPTLERWIDRIYTDGSWSGNLFDFYRKVYRKLTADLKVPFNLVGDKRIDRTPAHEAIREALVNTIAHADFNAEGNILIEKHPDFIGFRNPGLMRVPVKEAIAGGNSQCRNPAIHQMFLNIGLSEKAGSGIPNIYRNSKRQNWQQPNLYENDELGQTILELRMVDIISEEMQQKLIARFGERFNQLSDLKRTILITAMTESWFNHERICAITSEYTREVTLALSQLVASGYLDSSGKQKGKTYHLKGIEVPTPDNDAGKSIKFVTTPTEEQLSLFTGNVPEFNQEVPDLDNQSPELNRKVPELDNQSPDLDNQSPDLDNQSPDLDNQSPDLDKQNQLLWQQLQSVVSPIIQSQGRKPKAEIEQAIITLCKIAEPSCLKLADIATLLMMKPDTLRRNYLSKMIKAQKLYLAYPTIPNHPEQGYTTQQHVGSKED
ncbi:RNA-binding domain-containing protein [Vibrio aphrogenes]|uniref:RNA-binding domain-containing protein n=1 Tax=Vibrio aphrogenes TaxID=1891186 RepID=UPI000B363F5A|nr:RNA-binding domain-containing protein [Vibrio aphrogenes]